MNILKFLIEASVNKTIKNAAKAVMDVKGGLYELLDRVSCKFCGLKNLKELRNIYSYIPSVWHELEDYQRHTDRPYKGNDKSVFDLEVRFKLEDEFMAAGIPINGKAFFVELKKRLGVI